MSLVACTRVTQLGEIISTSAMIIIIDLKRFNLIYQYNRHTNNDAFNLRNIVLIKFILKYMLVINITTCERGNLLLKSLGTIKGGRHQSSLPTDCWGSGFFG